MIEIHDLPSCKPKQALFYTYINNAKSSSITIEKLVLLEKSQRLESEFIGVQYKVQISTSQVNQRPRENDLLMIDNEEYKIISCNFFENNPVFVPFFECEVKTTRMN